MNIPAELDKAKTEETRIVGEAKVEASRIKALWTGYKAEIIGIAAIVAFVTVIAYQLFKKVV